MSEIVSHFVKQHIQRSRSDLSDPAQAERWTNGERAREEAAEIVASLLCYAEKQLEQGENPK